MSLFNVSTVYVVTGDPALQAALMQGALISDQDISPDCPVNLFLHTDDQNAFDHFEHLEPPLSDDDYMFSLQPAEGISDLFDVDAPYDIKDINI